MNELLIPKDWAECIPHSSAPVDVRDHLNEAHTIRFLDLELFEHARWSIRYQMAVVDHRGNYWVTMYQEPATEMQDGIDPFLFTRMVDDIECVVFSPAERYEVSHWRYRPVVDENGF